MIGGHEKAANDSLTMLTEAKAICRIVELAMHEGNPETDDVRYAIGGVARLIDDAANISAMFVDELAQARRAVESEVRS